MHSTLISSVSRRLLASTGVFCAAMSLAAVADAQITAPAGSGSQDNRTAPMGTKSDPPPAHTLESNTPQAAEAKPEQRSNAKNKAGHKPEGAGGFDNGLYGTGAGSNK
ncbi:hypothetical protein VOI32_10040 [Paraburkholderia caribensis]|uniref:Beta-xylosidase n=1 Tax=Paraburkholderia caribensis TaxID=75105 RepID=A0A9Q6S4L4_9BURK|nr:hypothetical protein [Paraburkholderia caribensis]MCO4876093.1 hypothetical protein [Paraburkholderia caribensis]PTB29471.1 hypothetical protein C9I56_07530 [Paraburkholderia caribensis]QLB64752.1 hypothetical protein A9O66_20110 [Paraburkholderia caribensis]